MKSKKIRSLFCAAALTLSLAACGSKTSDYSDQTITGEITDIDGTAVTMQLGELSAGGMPSHDVSGSSDSGQTPPDKPDGETQSGSSFTAGEESVTLDFANAEITKNDESIELGDLAEGDILTVEVGSNNTAASATVESVGGGQSFGGSGEVTQAPPPRPSARTAPTAAEATPRPAMTKTPCAWTARPSRSTASPSTRARA